MNIELLRAEGFKRQGHRIFQSTGANAVGLAAGQRGGMNALPTLSLSPIGVKDAIWVASATIQAYDPNASGFVALTAGNAFFNSSGGFTFDQFGFHPGDLTAVLGSSQGGLVARISDLLFFGRDLAMLSSNQVIQMLSGVTASNNDGVAGHTITAEAFINYEVWRQL